MSRFEALPQELRWRILGFLFEDSQARARDLHGVNLDDCPTDRVIFQHPGLPRFRYVWDIRLNPDFKTLFVSKAYLQDALPMFAQTTEPELFAIHTFMSPGHANIDFRPLYAEPYHIYRKAVATLMDFLRCIRIQMCNISHLFQHRNTFPLYLPSLRRIDYFEHKPRAWDYSSARGEVVEAFPGYIMANNFSLHRRRMLTQREVRDLMERHIFPGRIDILLRHIGSTWSKWPAQLHQLVTLHCLLMNDQPEDGDEILRMVGSLILVRRKDVNNQITVDEGRST